jgi:hypothetical protein
MTVLTVGRFAGLGVGHVPERHVDLACRLVAERHTCCPRQSKHSVLAVWNQESESLFAFLRTLAGLTDSQWPYLLIPGSSLFFLPKQS